MSFAGYRSVDQDLHPLVEMLRSGDERAIAALDMNNSEALAPKFHVFAARVTCKYQSPKGRMINSLRPFGDGIYNREGSFADSITFGFQDFKSDGNSGISEPIMELAGIGNTELIINAPASYNRGAPWTKVLPDPVREKMRGKLNDAQFERLGVAELSDAEVKEWLEDQAKNTRWSIEQAIQRLD
jgi:hypothetical protein